MTFWSAIISFSFLSLFLSLLTIFIMLRCTIGLVMYLRPNLKAIINRHAAERNARREAENKKKPSKRAVWAGVFLYAYTGINMIIIDAMFHHSKDAATFKDRFLPHFMYFCEKARVAVHAQILALSFLFLSVTIFSLVRAIVCQHRQQYLCVPARTDADKERCSVPGETVDVEAQQAAPHVLEQILIDLSDGMNSIYEKMELFVTPDVTKQDKEPLIKS
ncbi:hypothetical protein GYMLUDRAFT_41124 [Collybiopsis luxurians FD-317 M1]|uniref:Unplaced genomic scaffold GYMLUscaffold_16, whole genome shotgun sequence n=1 Tax=Collybiopsis luxurians FD-317 M1 TaxID=944289 RepID=A0A0D0D2K1_9AGAR|nr:hypothetical protein GYMLUDRAFT_41124 [Collybiopsis luxurians FD-317 M1]